MARVPGQLRVEEVIPTDQTSERRMYRPNFETLRKEENMSEREGWGADKLFYASSGRVGQGQSSRLSLTLSSPQEARLDSVPVRHSKDQSLSGYSCYSKRLAFTPPGNLS